VAVTVADSDVLIDFLRASEPEATQVAEALRHGRLATTVVNLFELMSGARSRRQREGVADLLAALEIYTMDEASAQRAAEVRRDLEARGEGIGMADYLIAGICLSRGLPLLTRNRRHFERIADLSLA